jgi:hypothetical protein
LHASSLPTSRVDASPPSVGRNWVSPPHAQTIVAVAENERNLEPGIATLLAGDPRRPSVAPDREAAPLAPELDDVSGLADYLAEFFPTAAHAAVTPRAH